ncbi:MAG: peptide chain release factor N(5)-glutamine methyltransferase [Alphaproteobacteria bacterium]|nr:peptide chain release factor N(5)-glutamine methyltransferase [Alphaproteobacteria bacterium]
MTARQSISAAAVLAEIAARLPDNGKDDPRRDARHLLALAIEREDAVMPHETVTVDDAAAARLEQLIGRRAGGEPISRIKGKREFYGLDFAIDAATLDPRPDSETLVDVALDWLKDDGRPGMTMLDLGTGSGCLILAIAHEFNSREYNSREGSGMTGLGLDIQPPAITMARHNAEALGLSEQVKFQESDWDAALGDDQRFDLIISNPPYIPTPDLDGLMAEVRLHDPRQALDGGADGLDEWRRLAPVIRQHLQPQGMACVEIGQGQDGAVEELFSQHGLRLVEARRDLGGIVRCLRFALQRADAAMDRPLDSPMDS